jgi:hypothetical protein
MHYAKQEGPGVRSRWQGKKFREEGGGGDVRIEYGGIVATIKVQHEKASGQSPRFARKWRIENTY